MEQPTSRREIAPPAVVADVHDGLLEELDVAGLERLPEHQARLSPNPPTVWVARAVERETVVLGGVRERLVALAGCDGCCPGVRTGGDGGGEALAGMLAPGSGAVGEAERRQVGSGIARSRARAAVKLTAQGQRAGRWSVS